MKPGAELGPRTIDPVDSESMRVLAEILADPNPIHLDGAAAQAAGLGDRPVNQGPANLGYVLDMLRDSLPGVEVTQLRARLLRNVCQGDLVVARGRVERVESLVDRTRIGCQVWLEVEGGATALEGRAELVI